MTDRPTGTVTFLFTDIQGSTSRWEEQTEEMRAALARHDEALKCAIEAHDGWAFKHTGDGMLAAFASPRSAVQAAIDAQRALELPVRMGIATGEAELRGDDYFGPTLNRAARIMSAGHGGQVLVAPSTASLVSGIDLLDLGEHRLRDLSQPQRLYQVRAEGLREKFPALRTLDATPGNLPLQTTAFIGRESELAAVVEAVHLHRLVTLTGVGGVGKTRLALQSAAELVADFPDGVWLIELAPVGDLDAVPDAVLGTLGIQVQPGLSVAQSIAEASVGRVRLLILDNCEHVLDSVAGLVELLISRSATIRVLATSREGLGVAGEHLWPVPSLGVREGGESEGVALFAERARAVAPRFSLDRAADAEAVLDICQRLDGIPLAIELAAARMAHMTAPDVRARLNDRFRLLSGSRRAVERHQTLRNAVQWSYDLLDEDERTLLDRLSVFAGGFDLDGAAAVVGGAEFDEYAVLDVLRALVDKSLLTVMHTDDGHTRYGMLETIRQFAEERLGLAGLAEKVRVRHAAHFAAKAQQMYDGWRGTEVRRAHDWLDAELSNLRTAYRWAAGRDDLDTATAIVVPAALFAWYTERWDILAWTEELLPAAQPAHHRRLPGLLAIAAQAAMNAGRNVEAVGRAKAVIESIDDPRYDPPPLGLSHHFLGLVYGNSGRVGEAIAEFDAEVARSGDPMGWARILGTIWRLNFDRTSDVRDLARDGFGAARMSGNPAAIAWGLLAEGLALFSSDSAGALLLLRQAWAQARESRSFEATFALTIIPFEVWYGDPAAALDSEKEVLEAFYRVGVPHTIRASLAMAAMVLFRLGHHDASAVLVGASAGGPPLAGLAELAASVREARGNIEFERLAAQGGEMDLAQAVAYGRRELTSAQESLGAPP